MNKQTVPPASAETCSGCAACSNVCPRGCLQMKPDSEGFLFPVADSEKCIHCGKCASVCPSLQEPAEKRLPESSFAVLAKDRETCDRSSSGGFFSLLAEKVLAKGGIVFGAAFDDAWNVYHTGIESMADLDRLRRSKYVQSSVGNAFSDCLKALQSGRPVLFSGTPCQIKALNLFLGKPYENLTTVDFICHGVPSPEVFRRYLKESVEACGKKVSEIQNINFRDKSMNAETTFAFSVQYADEKYMEPARNNPYTAAFLADVSLRRSCYHCQARRFWSGADYTLSDFWQVRSLLPDFCEKTERPSLVYVSRDTLGMFAGEPSNARICKLTPAQSVNVFAAFSPYRPAERDRFFRALPNGSVIPLLKKYSALSFATRLKKRIYMAYCRRMAKCFQHS